MEADSVDQNDVAWREEQVVNGQRVICVYTKSNDLIVSDRMRAVNFRGHIRNQQDLTEMLLTVLTHDPVHGYPVELGTVTTPLPRRPALASGTVAASGASAPRRKSRPRFRDPDAAFGTMDPGTHRGPD